MSLVNKDSTRLLGNKGTPAADTGNKNLGTVHGSKHRRVVFYNGDP